MFDHLPGDNAQSVHINLMLIQQVKHTAHLGPRTNTDGVYPPEVMNILAAIQRNAHQEVIILEKTGQVSSISIPLV